MKGIQLPGAAWKLLHDGDNRDFEFRQPRYWGFVPEQNIVGKAFLVWWNFQRTETHRQPYQLAE